MSASSPTSSAFCEAICASTESSVAFWTSVCRPRRVEPRLRGDVAGDELGLAVEGALRVGELGRDPLALGREVAQRRLGAHARRADAVDAGLAHAEIGARLLDVGVGGVAPGPDLGRVEPGDDLPLPHLAVVVGEDLDHLPRQLRPDEHGRDRVQRAGRAHARRDRAAVDRAEPVGHVGGAASARAPDEQARCAGKERRDDRREKETPHEILAAESAEGLFSLIFAARAS